MAANAISQDRPTPACSTGPTSSGQRFASARRQTNHEREDNRDVVGWVEILAKLIIPPRDEAHDWFRKGSTHPQALGCNPRAELQIMSRAGDARFALHSAASDRTSIELCPVERDNHTG